MKHGSLDELEVIAAQTTRRALEEYVIPDTLAACLVRGITFEGDDRIFELYIPGERPEDAVVISQARVNALDGSVKVHIYNLEQRKT